MVNIRNGRGAIALLRLVVEAQEVGWDRDWIGDVAAVIDKYWTMLSRQKRFGFL